MKLKMTKKDIHHLLSAFSQKQHQALGTWWLGGSILHSYFTVLQSCSTALLNCESGLLGRSKKQWMPVLRLLAENIGAHTRTTGFHKCFISGNENVFLQVHRSQALAATSTSWHFSVIFLLLFLNFIPSFTASLLLLK